MIYTTLNHKYSATGENGKPRGWQIYHELASGLWYKDDFKVCWCTWERAFWLCGSVSPGPWFSLSSVWQLANSINFFLAEQERDQWKVNVGPGILIQRHPEQPLHCELWESGPSGRIEPGSRSPIDQTWSGPESSKQDFLGNYRECANLPAIDHGLA